MSEGSVKGREVFTALLNKSRQQWELRRGPDRPYVLVGTATCGRSAGALAVRDAFIESFEELGLTVPVMDTGCHGHCYAEPMAVVKRPGYPGMIYHHLTPIIVRNLTQKFFLEEDPYLDVFLGAVEDNELGLPRMADLPRWGREERRLLARAGVIDPDNIVDAIANGAYAGLAAALEMSPEQCLESLQRSGLRGLGGAGFPIWRKWEMLRNARETERYLICNADEGDPGAFMDRAIIESDPHALIEGLLIGARVTAAAQGFIYVRAEYPLAVRRMRRAIKAAREAGLLGEAVLGTGLNFDVDVMEGAGAFVCGEETALIASVEGRRGMPRVRPPYPSESGLFEKPTAVNNVKTLAYVPRIVERGPEWFCSVGTEQSKGTAVFALAGKIANTGLVEVAMGATLREVIFEIGGGVPHHKKFKAVQIGGPSGGCLPEAMLDTPIDFDSLRDAGAIMGSGGMVVLDEDNCLVDTARFFLEFTQHESCGKCTFCRIGTRQMLDIIKRITAGEGRIEDLDLLEEMARDIKAGALCNLGKTAPNPVLTTLKYFREEYQEHIREHFCRAKVCKAMTAYYIDPKKCVRSCDACVGSCPPEAIYANSKRIKVVDQELCVRCNSCMGSCPPEYDAIRKISPLREVPPSEPRPEKKKEN
ncbi:MAG TPA: NADH-ubiquinone oxidoreductase-F iron-sulfur binding region domain-containing protein [bacterium]|nr:NADH-ubiquinone oxidoreductase-F iron-sulfur binding region domain-containing protein [bacterium]